MSFETELARDAERMRQQAPAAQVQDLRELGQDLVDLEEQIARTESELSGLKERRNELALRLIPDMMDAIGVDRIGLPGAGVDLVVKPFYKAVLPKEHREAAIAWLDEHGHGEMVKTEVAVEFSPGEREHANNVQTLIESYFRGRNIEQKHPTVDHGVHWKTLSAFVKEQMQRGVSLPLDLLGAQVGSIASVVPRSKQR